MRERLISTVWGREEPALDLPSFQFPLRSMTSIGLATKLRGLIIVYVESCPFLRMQYVISYVTSFVLLSSVV